MPDGRTKNLATMGENAHTDYTSCQEPVPCGAKLKYRTHKIKKGGGDFTPHSAIVGRQYLKERTKPASFALLRATAISLLLLAYDYVGVPTLW